MPARHVLFHRNDKVQHLHVYNQQRMCCGLEAATKEAILYADSETIPLPLHIRQANIKNNMVSLD